MIEVDMSRLLPGFLLRDGNGAAMAKALETGMRMFCRVVEDGIRITLNVEKMPEWRLDEMAWELGCLYDFNADIENKRVWIRDAVPLYASYGTVAAIYKHLGGYFDDVEVEEHWQYGGEPYHFRITVGGEWTNEKEQWAKNAVGRTKNVRSILDDLSIGSRGTVKVAGETMWRRFPYEATQAGHLAGTAPQTAFAGKTADGDVLAQADAKGFPFPYPAAGTIPRENTLGKSSGAAAVIGFNADGYVFPYPAVGQENKTGTWPKENTQGKNLDAAAALLSGESSGYIFPYPATGNEEKTGTKPRENTVFAQDSTAATARSEGVGAVFSYPLCGEETI